MTAGETVWIKDQNRLGKIQGRTQRHPRPFLVAREGGILPCVGYTGMCGPKGYGFSAVLVIKWVSILAIFVINREWHLHSSLDMGILFNKKTFFRHFRKDNQQNPFTNYVYVI